MLWKILNGPLVAYLRVHEHPRVAIHSTKPASVTMLLAGLLLCDPEHSPRTSRTNTPRLRASWHSMIENARARSHSARRRSILEPGYYRLSPVCSFIP